jgi:hypothetical protein
MSATAPMPALLQKSARRADLDTKEQDEDRLWTHTPSRYPPVQLQSDEGHVFLRSGGLTARNAFSL